MSTTNFDIKGYEKIIKDLEELSRKGVRAKNKAIKAGGEVFAEELREAIPVSEIDHEHIKDNIIVTDIKRKGGVPHVRVGANGEVGWRFHFLEFGTMFMSPVAPAQKTIQSSKTKVKQKMKDVLQKELGL
ncbi:HK97-gp10 family putative phage morphogenesis protein [Peribacillus frigoritolerans]|uniref:HK97 gp10 family phage protein n=1 Tax=Peribacillus castrilensis TaxID=2897690 RepID=A0AAW9NQC0_9BACI|nr:HK97 gp10 family phage protein [Peribacillus castrilensis]